MKLGEYGIIYRLNAQIDISSFAALTLTFTKPSGATLVVTNPAVAVPSVDVTTDIGVFTAKEYVEYVFVQGDVDESGPWKAQLLYDDGTPRHLISNVARFFVNPA